MMSYKRGHQFAKNLLGKSHSLTKACSLPTRSVLVNSRSRFDGFFLLVLLVDEDGLPVRDNVQPQRNHRHPRRSTEGQGEGQAELHADSALAADHLQTHSSNAIQEHLSDRSRLVFPRSFFCFSLLIALALFLSLSPPATHCLVGL